MVTIYPNVLLRKVEKPVKGGIPLPDPIDRLVECTVVRNVVYGEQHRTIVDNAADGKIFMYANSRVFIRAKTPSRGSWEDADLYLVDDIVASA